MRTAVLTLSRLSSPCWCLILLSIGSPCMAQEQSGSPFACVEGAVQLDIDNDPGLTFEALDGSPGYFPAHEFTFDQSVFQRVRVYLAATLPEEFVGRASEAKLSVYVETSASIDAASAQRSQWWQLVPAPGREATANENPSHSLVFDAMRIANCFGIGRGQSDCAFADVSLAASDENVPMIVIAFTQDLGGANASNWIDFRLLLDFRESPPRVAATADCAYNEGGGACTAIDSGMMPRTTLQCDWAAAVSDFLCTEQGGGHRDFYLMSDRVPPPRSDEVASLEEAAKVLARRGIGQTVTVWRLGPVVWIDQVTMDEQRSAMLLASRGSFYLVSRSNDGIGPILEVGPHALLDDTASAEAVGLPQGEWTGDFVPLFRSSQIFGDGRLAILQVVETRGANSSDPPSGLYWIGIELGTEGFMFDAVQLVGGAAYDHCGMFKLPASVVSVGVLSRPFQAHIRVQPPTVDGLDSDDPAWESASEREDTAECVRNGNLWWKHGRFEADIDREPCAAPEEPHRIRIEPDGRLSLEKPFEREE